MRKSYVLNKAFLEKSLHEFEAVIILKSPNRSRIGVVDKIVVEIVEPRSLQLCLKDILRRPVGSQYIVRQFIGDRVAFSWVFIQKAFFDQSFAFPIMIHPGRVEVVEPSGHILVNHLLYLLYIKAFRVVRICERQSHHAETEFFLFHVFSFQSVKNEVSSLV